MASVMGKTVTRVGKKRPYRENKVIWCGNTMYPPWVGFCPTEKAWAQFMKEYNVKPPVPYPTTDAALTAFDRHNQNVTAKLLLLVTINKKYDNKEAVALIPLLAHEVMHALRYIWKDIGEDAPACEQEAYAMQFYLQEILVAYRRTRRPPALRRIP